MYNEEIGWEYEDREIVVIGAKKNKRQMRQSKEKTRSWLESDIVASDGEREQTERDEREKNNHSIKQQHERQRVKEAKGRQREAKKN